MIYCVRFSDVVDALARLSYSEAERTGATRVFAGPHGGRVLLRAPNQEGHLPEILVNDAFDVAGLTPPVWDVFWCD